MITTFGTSIPDLFHKLLTNLVFSYLCPYLKRHKRMSRGARQLWTRNMPELQGIVFLRLSTRIQTKLQNTEVRWYVYHIQHERRLHVVP